MTNEPAPQLDTDILGLQWTLVSWLAERDFVQFDDYSVIEVDMGNAEIKIDLMIPWGGKIEAALRLFAAQNNFPTVFHDEPRNSVYLMRRLTTQ